MASLRDYVSGLAGITVVKRSELVQAVAEARAIVEEAIPGDPGDRPVWALRAAALPEILRELLDNEVVAP